MPELYQIYDDLCQPIEGHGAPKDTVLTKGLLHAASHVWMWRKKNDTIELLLQKRGSGMRTWPNRNDVSAAGHISLGEDPVTTALRETQEELGLTLQDSDLKLIDVMRAHMISGNEANEAIENEYQWVYLVQLTLETTFTMQPGEVDGLTWKSLADFKQEIREKTDLYVPHGNPYFETVIAAIEAASQE